MEHKLAHIRPESNQGGPPLKPLQELQTCNENKEESRMSARFDHRVIHNKLSSCAEVCSLLRKHVFLCHDDTFCSRGLHHTVSLCQTE